MENEKITDLKDMLSKSVKKYANKTLYKLENKEITYQEMQEKVNCLGTSLTKLGLKNKKIAIISENRYEWEIAYFAIACGTGIVVPLDKSLTKVEILTILERTEVEAVFCSGKYKNILSEIKEELKNLKYIISFDGENILSFETLIKEGKQLIETGNKEFVNAKVDNESTAFIMFTSGTTDKSKAIMLSHRNVCSNIENVAQVFNITHKDIALSVLPLSHIFEGAFCLLLTIYKGATRTYCYDLKNIIEDINQYKISFMGAVPAIYKYIYKRIDEIDKQNINLFMSGGAILENDLEYAFNKNNIKLLQGYGLTETSPIISINNKELHKIGSVGKIIPNIELKLANKDEEGIGEIAVKGENVFLGYYQNNEETEQVLKDGWFYTGDLAKIDEDGFVFLYGRKKNIIVLPNGKKVFPEEIESIINKIEGVKESFVFDKKVSENKAIICAKIVCENIEHEQEILNKIQEINKNMPVYKHIMVSYITEEEIKKTYTGKIKRKEELDKINSQNSTEEISSRVESIEEDKVLKKVNEIISKQLGIEEKEISKNSYITDMGADSLDKVEIIFTIEKEFMVKIPKEEYFSMNSPEEISKYIKYKFKK